MKCPNIPPMKEPIKCGELRPIPIEERRQLLERQAWINNVKRVLGMTDAEAQKQYAKIQMAKRA